MRVSLLRSPRILAALLVLGGATLLPSPKADAVDAGVINMKPGDVVNLGFPTIQGNNTTGEASNPINCRNDPVASTFCNVHRVKVEVPPNGLGYFIQVQMGWENRVDQKGVPEFEQITDNDMDLYAYNVPYVEAAKEKGNTHATGGATTKQPEVMYIMPSPEVDLVVVNYLGVNSGYTLKLTYVVDEVFTPFESLDPEFMPTIAPTPSAAPVVVAAVPPPPPPSGPIDVSPGLGLVGVDDPFGLAQPLRDGRPALDLIKSPTPASANKQVNPVSSASVLLWLAVLPGALLGTIATMLYRRRQGFSVQ